MGLHPDNRSGSDRTKGGGRLLVLLTVAGCLLAVLAASAIAGGLRPNPANHRALLKKPIEGFDYDYARGCRNSTPRGMKALQSWLERNVRGESWGIMRCERLRPAAGESAARPAERRGNFSLHSEGRAIDWHLDAGVKKQRKAAMRLMRTLLARDRKGNPQALARRMGVQGLIFDCKSWWSGGTLDKYSYCYRSNGKPRNGLDRTAAHRDHVHIELNRDGARKRTSFWRTPNAHRSVPR